MPKYECSCGAKYKFPDSSAGKKAKCKQCAAVFTLPEADADEGIFAIAADSPLDTEVSAASARADAYARAEALAKAKGLAEAKVEDVPAKGNAKEKPLAEVRHSRGYMQNVLWTFLFPAGLGNLFAFFFLWFVVALVGALSLGGPLGLIIFLVAYGWFSAYRFDVIRGAAGGDQELPEMSFGRDGIGEYVGNAIKWLVSWLYVFAPAIAYLLVQHLNGTLSVWEFAGILAAGVSGIRDTAETMPAYSILVIAGLLLWPMVILCLALGGRETLLRPDLMVVSIVRSLHGYFLTLVMMLAAFAVGMGGEYLLESMVAGGAAPGAGPAGGPTVAPGLTGNVILAGILLSGLQVYLSIVICRLIGFYYRHFKERFAWDWG